MVALLLVLVGVANGLTVDWSWKAPPYAEVLPMPPGIAPFQPRDRDFFAGATDEVVLTVGFTQLRAHSAKTGEVLWQKTLGVYSLLRSSEIGEKGAFLLGAVGGDALQGFSAQEGAYLALATHLQKDCKVLIEVWDARDGTAVRSFTVGPLITQGRALEIGRCALALNMGEEGSTVAWVSPEGRIVVERMHLGSEGMEWRSELPIPSVAGWDVPTAARRTTVVVCPLEGTVLVVATWPDRAESELHLLDAKTGTELRSVRLPFWVLEATYAAEKKVILLTASDAWSGYGWGTEGDVVVALRAEDLNLVWSRNAGGVVPLGKLGLSGDSAYLLVIPEEASGKVYRPGEKVVCAEIGRFDVSDGAYDWVIRCVFEQGLLPSKNEKLVVQRRASASPIVVGDRVVVVLPGFAYQEGKTERCQVLLMSCEDGKELARVTVEAPAGPRLNLWDILNGPVGLHQVGDRIYLDTFGGGLFGLSLR
jgi:hypothetical protein